MHVISFGVVHLTISYLLSLYSYAERVVCDVSKHSFG